jgi:hypothetical protein
MTCRCFLSFFSAFLAISLFAQSPTATLVGRLSDPSGALVPEAAIELRNVNTGQSRHVSSGGAGEFTIPDLAPGQYEVVVIKVGFQQMRQTNIVLQVDQTARLDLQMIVGAVSQTVEVSASLPVLNTENSGRGDVIVAKEMTEMPLNGRDLTDLAFLIPGVSEKQPGSQGSSFAVSGARADNTNFLIDGFNDREGRGAGPQVSPHLDAMQEFKVQTTGYSAEYGHVAGGVVNMVLKSGGNQLHGTMFEFVRNDLFDARNFYDVGKSKLRRNQFGAILNGPVYIPRIYDGRNKTFFVVSWESLRPISGENNLGRVPTALERNGDFSQTKDATGNPILLRDPLATGVCTATDSSGCFPGNRIPSSRFHPAAKMLLEYYPLPNRPGYSSNFLNNSNTISPWDSFIYKVDQRISEEDTISLRFIDRHSSRDWPFKQGALGTFGSYTEARRMLGGVSYTRVFTPRLINELRAGITRQTNYEKGYFAGQDIAAKLGIPGTIRDPILMDFPLFSITDFITLGDASQEPIRYTLNVIQLSDSVTWAKSRHLIKFGGEILRNQYFEPSNLNRNGAFTFLGRLTNNSFGDFLLGMPNSATRALGSSTSYMLWSNYAMFLQDDFKVRPSLTLNLGVRYEIAQPMMEKYGRWSSFIPKFGKVILAGTGGQDVTSQIQADGLTQRFGMAGDYGLPSSLVYTRWGDVAPRLGFAWRPWNRTRTVVRGAYGIFSADSMKSLERRDMSDTYPFNVSQTFTRDTRNPLALTLSNPFPNSLLGAATGTGVTNAVGTELNPPLPYLQSWNVTIERELWKGSALEIAYSGSKGTHLGKRYNLNQAIRSPELQLPNGTFPKPYPQLNAIWYYTFGSNSNYNAGIITLRKRYERGLFYRLNYVYAKSIDDASQVSGSGNSGYSSVAQNSRNLRLERGRSDWDVGHTMTITFSYNLPLGSSRLWGGWQLAGTGRMHSGSPFTPMVSNAQLDQGQADRPDRVAKGRLDNRTAERWFDLAAFPVVPLGAFHLGNSGRNILDCPGYMALNLGLMKRFEIRDKGSLQFRWELFNATNRTNFEYPVKNVNAANAATIQSAGDARVMQFALKYQF